MLFPEEDAPLLKQWIVKRLENTSDADADVLADYVLALLRHDGDTEAVKTLCMTEIPDFLKEDSTIFVRDVFDTIQYRSYIPGAQAPLRRPSLPFAPPAGPSIPNYGNPAMAGGFGIQNGSRKRLYNERGDGDAQDSGMGPVGDLNGRMYKQPRRGGLPGRGGFDNFNGRGGFGPGRQPLMNPRGLSPEQFPLPGIPPLDPNDPMAFMLAMQTMGLPFPPPANDRGLPPPRHMHQRKQRCRDYDQKGFCARGNTCMFEHGENSIFVPPKNDEYDPANAGLMTGIEVNGNPSGPAPFNNNIRGNDRGRGRGLGRGDRGGQHGNPSRRGGRAEFSSDRPNHDKTKTTIVVENIPEEKFSEDEVQEFFSQFGNVVDVSMRPYKRLAIVKYDTWDAANAAYGSPKVIFDNRFVKVYWFTSQENLPKPATVTGANGTALKNSSSLTPVSVPARTRETSVPQVDSEEFARKQEEAQRIHEEKTKKKLEMEIARKELEKRQQELSKSREEEKKRLMEKLAAKGVKSEQPIKSEDGTIAPSQTTSQTDALKAQLAALEAEAQSLGIDTSLANDTSYGYRGRGRGRGGYRGRGSFAPRGFRGGYRGRGGSTFGGGGAYKLDNRPKKIALTGVDFSDAEKDESLRQFLLGIGEYTALEITSSKTSITFKDRFTAEKFMYGLPEGEVPSVGKVDLAWVSTPLPLVNIANHHPTLASSEGAVMEEGDAMAVDSSPTKGSAGAIPAERGVAENLDYDVADDNEWGAQ